MMKQHWPWIVAGLAGIGIAFAADSYLTQRDMIRATPLPEPVGSCEMAPPPPRSEAVNPPPRRPEESPAAPPQGRPSPQPERARAIQRLEVNGMKPTGDALVKAAMEGEAGNLELLLTAGVEPSALNSEGRPALVAATAAGRTEVVKLLLEAGANLNISDAEGRTPFLTAAAVGNVELLQYFAKEGADVGCVDAKGANALHLAIDSQSASAVQWVLVNVMSSVVENLFDTSLVNEGMKSLVVHAVNTKNPEIIEPILQYFQPEQWADETKDALMEAIRRQDKMLIRLLITHHKEAPTPRGAAQPLLGYAIAWGEPAVLRLLLECGADPNTPLQSPVEPKFSGLVTSKFLRHYLEKEGGMTPLMLAAGKGDLESAQILMEHGAKRNAYTKKSKMLPISFAARTTPEMMQVILGKSPRPEDQRVRVEISLASQTAKVYRDNQVVMSSSISTGRPGFRTPTGRYVITDKHRVRVSSIYHSEMPYFMRLSCSAVGMHAGVVPGYPASHGCIRLPYSNAKQFYGNLEVGTLVTIR